MSAPAVRLNSITKRFGPVLANDAIDLHVPVGTVHGIIGENGAGKSTLVSILYGFYAADAGTVEIDGSVARIASPSDAIAHGIGMVHQHFMLVPTFTVLENVMLGAEGGAMLKQGAEDVRAELLRLEEDYGLEVDPDALVGDLPVGLQQRVEILKALRRGARILILDEPTGVLTPDEADRLFEILRGLKKDGVTVLLITHKLAEIMAICDGVSVMRRGRMVGHRKAADTSPEDLAELMVGRKVVLETDRGATQPGDVLLRTEVLSATDHTGAPRLRDVTLEMRAGEVLGIAGVSGNGQSELLEILSGIRPVEAGSFHAAGRRVDAAHPMTPADMRAMGIAHIPEDRHRRGLVLPFEARENVVLGYPGGSGDGPWATPGAMEATARPLIEEFDVRPPDPRLPARGFSGGNQQKIVIAREMAAAPQILLIGQPTRGVDIGAIEFIHAQIIALKQRGCAILLVSVELDEILALSDRITVMNGGRIVGTVAREDTTRQQLGMMMGGEAAA
ncbi:MAG: ABC transporter ATP-binding protein [Pseudomonadota bacterium]